jgi:hypothetical protein
MPTGFRIYLGNSLRKLLWKLVQDNFVQNNTYIYNLSQYFAKIKYILGIDAISKLNSFVETPRKKIADILLSHKASAC